MTVLSKFCERATRNILTCFLLETSLPCSKTKEGVNKWQRDFDATVNGQVGSQGASDEPQKGSDREEQQRTDMICKEGKKTRHGVRSKERDW